MLKVNLWQKKKKKKEKNPEFSNSSFLPERRGMEMGVEVKRHRATRPPYCPIPAAPVPLNHVTDGPLSCAVPSCM